ncbi:Mlp family lipoprotein [Borrelia duttonii]|uniref:ORFk-like protein, lipoprotein n=1 Tax=Borrelia duttonii (strain Ly) TaxID=412419 RepID=B5RP63_BORDL|nr:ORFk-like protein, lipoprotein [Borrelia duttonii Ly]ACH94240.1 ORFk-like protein, lipoprotein [Borrelia duttonii Ly]
MNKNKGILILCIILFLYGCNSNKNPVKVKGETSRVTRSIDQHDSQNTLTTEEKNRFESLQYAMNTEIEAHEQTLKRRKTNPSEPLSELSAGIIKTYKRFIKWISDDSNIEKQRELSDAFKNVYNFLEQKREKLASKQHPDMKRYIQGAFYDIQDNEYKKKHQYDPNLYGGPKNKKYNRVREFFHSIRLNTVDIYYINNDTSNETILKKMKEELQNKESDTYKDSLALWTD